MIPVPDLLFPDPHYALDGEALNQLLELAYMGGESGTSLEKVLSEPQVHGSTWNPDFFGEELFLRDFVRDSLRVEVEGHAIPVNRAFLREVLSRPPCDLETVEFRQSVLRELEDDAELLEATRQLYAKLYYLLSMFMAWPERARLDPTIFRLEILEKSRSVVDFMAEEFSKARSGLRRLGESGTEIRASKEYQLLTDLLDYENHLARLTFRIRLGADGKIRNLTLEELTENVRNPFYRNPWRRLKDRLDLLRRGYEFSRKEVVNRVVGRAFLQIRSWLRPLLQVMCQLSFYLSALSFKEQAEELGLAVTLAEVDESHTLRLEGLFNPLLFRQGAPVPCNISADAKETIMMITGPNSGGKTRLLQAVGLAQLLGQSGMYTPARVAQIPLLDGLFASITERATVDQTEGRLGTELMRIRELFEAASPRSMLILDELCSGTNPSEAEEIVLMVLQLLERLNPVALITTHFLDFGRRLASEEPVSHLRFLQVELNAEQLSTYQFIPGVAETSLAANTAKRLGVTFEELSALVDQSGEDS
jgi:DNA mismatch repair protein MutS2